MVEMNLHDCLLWLHVMLSLREGQKNASRLMSASKRSMSTTDFEYPTLGAKLQTVATASFLL